MTKLIFASLASSAALFAADSEGAGSGAPAPAVANGATLAPLTDEAKVTAIKKAMPSRKVYSTLTDAVQAMQKAGGETENFFGLPTGIVGFDSTTNEIDESLYEGMNAVLGYVGSKGDKDKNRESGIKAIVMYPIPSLDSFLADEAGKNWLAKVMEKETGLVVFRNFRDAATLDEFQAGIAKSPKSVNEFITEHARGVAGLDTDTFDACWPGLRTFLKNNQPLIYKAMPAKAETLKAIRSASYATAEYPELEKAGFFAKIGQTIIGAAKSNTTKDANGQPQAAPLDTSAIESWLAGRDTLEIKKAEKESVDMNAALAAFENWAQ